MKRPLALLVIGPAVLLLAHNATSEHVANARSESYAYLGAAFGRFVADSYDFCGRGDPKTYYGWMDSAYKTCRVPAMGADPCGLKGFLTAKGEELRAMRDPGRKSRSETELAALLHRFVKSAIPRFSLDRGYEFVNVVRYGERQCFLQSVLIAGMLQRAGVDAGVAMVYKNTRGEETNNGHAITLVKLPDGTDIIVDASEKDPFARHQGLFVRGPNYRFVRPVFRRNSDTVMYYQPAEAPGRIPTSEVRGLDVSFIRSQFFYYRGERVQGGVVLTPSTRTGLEAAAKALRVSVNLCPDNPLAVYMLGRVCQVQGNADEARKLFTRARGLYARSGWTRAAPPSACALKRNALR